MPNLASFGSNISKRYYSYFQIFFLPLRTYRLITVWNNWLIIHKVIFIQIFRTFFTIYLVINPEFSWTALSYFNIHFPDTRSFGGLCIPTYTLRWFDWIGQSMCNLILCHNIPIIERFQHYCCSICKPLHCLWYSNWICCQRWWITSQFIVSLLAGTLAYCKWVLRHKLQMAYNTFQRYLPFLWALIYRYTEG